MDWTASSVSIPTWAVEIAASEVVETEIEKKESAPAIEPGPKGLNEHFLPTFGKTRTLSDRWLQNTEYRQPHPVCKDIHPVKKSLFSLHNRLHLFLLQKKVFEADPNITKSGVYSLGFCFSMISAVSTISERAMSSISKIFSRRASALAKFFIATHSLTMETRIAIAPLLSPSAASLVISRFLRQNIRHFHTLQNNIKRWI